MFFLNICYEIFFCFLDIFFLQIIFCKNIFFRNIFVENIWSENIFGPPIPYYPPPMYNTQVATSSYLLFEVEGGGKRNKRRTYGLDAHTYCLFYCIR